MTGDTIADRGTPAQSGSEERDILTRLRLTPADLTALVAQNGSLRSMLLGYAAEAESERRFLATGKVSQSVKPDDHDRKGKGDRFFSYSGHLFRREDKSLQTKSVKLKDGVWRGKAQVDGSDKSKRLLPNGHTVEATNLVVDEFDILAVSCFAFDENEWPFVYALNRDLPRTPDKKFAEEDRQFLLKTSVDVTWPVTAPFTADPLELLDKLVEEHEQAKKEAGGPFCPKCETADSP